VHPRAVRLLQRSRMISSVSPSILMSIWIEVTPSRVPATLKSMSPSASSRPRMSVSTATRSPSLISPIATPAHGRAIGTPRPSSRASPSRPWPSSELPFDSRMSETMRIVYGNSSYGGSTGSSARSASAPWPISRRLVPRIGFASPVENGGKL
jgi:hypothetical protein